MAKVNIQINERVTVPTALHGRIGIEWCIEAVLPRQNEAYLLRQSLEQLVETEAASTATSLNTLHEVAAAFLTIFQRFNNSTLYVTIHALESSATAYVQED